MNEPASREPQAPRRLSLRFAWIAATVAIAIIFSVVAIPPASADSAEQEAQRYTLILQNVFGFIQEHYVDEVQAKKLYEGAMKGMFEALDDPHSVFLAESDMEDLNDTTQGSFGGVGLYITKPTVAHKDGTPPFVEVASPIEDTPGWKAGISPGDLILSIDGESTAKLTMEQVLAKLRGVPGTDVTIQIRRGEKIEFPVKLTRAVIEVPSVKSAIINNEIGYVRIITFTPKTVERTGEALQSFRDKGCKYIIVDLRNDYGGLLQAAIGVVDYFLDSGVIVSTKSRIASENAVFTAKKSVLVDPAIPVIVMINRASASASEIVAGALKDTGRAYLVGEKSYGKGSVQQVFPLGTTGFKLTTARYYTPSDVNIDKIGIPPDLEVKLPEFTEKEAESFSKMVNDDRIPSFVKASPKATAAQVAAFVKELQTTYGLDEKLLRRLVRDEQNRTQITPVFDLEYDLQLNAAIDVFHTKNFVELMKGTKTLKILQDEAAKTRAVEDSSGTQASAAPSSPAN